MTMRTLIGALPFVVSLAASAAALPASAPSTSGPSTMVERANRAVQEGKPDEAKGLLEAAMRKDAGGKPGVFGPEQGYYWRVVRQGDDYPRAYTFFSALAAEHPDASEVLAAQANAIGGYLGWTKMHGLQYILGRDGLMVIVHGAREKKWTFLRIISEW